MFVEIWFRGDEPPTGLIKVEGDPPAEFQGWLGLLHAISTALADGPAEAGAPPFELRAAAGEAAEA
jgi:hypothetical protein